LIALGLAVGSACAEPVSWLGPNLASAAQLTERPWPAEAGRAIGGIKLYIGWLARIGDLCKVAQIMAASASSLAPDRPGGQAREPTLR
jgi:hypothetical protein